MTTPPTLDEVIEEARKQSFQERSKPNKVDSGLSTFSYLLGAGATIPPWWSTKRDIALRDFWKAGDHLSGAVYNMESKMTAIPFRVVARNPSNRTHQAQARHMQDVLEHGAEYGEGWQTFYGKWVEDLLTQDNGAFAEIIGPGSPTGPLSGAPISIAHLDSAQCQRTGDPEFPVIFHDISGKRRKIHYSRVLFGSQMSSPKQDMYGVGFCAVSRCVAVSQTLMDILIYKQEKLGSRPHRAILVTKGGLDPDEVADAFQAAQYAMDTQGLARYGRVVVLGSGTLPDAGLEKVELASLPEGFDEETSIVFGMATIALALGVDARELFPAMGGGASRADALLSHIKQRGKGPGQIISTVESLFNFKVLPPQLKMLFDLQDDAEDRQVADIHHVRSQARERNLVIEVTTIRTARQQMLANGELTDEQFETMELGDGRLPDGTSVLSLIYSSEKELTKYLKFSTKTPDDVENNDPQTMISEISRNLSKLHKDQAQTRSYELRISLRRAEAALLELKKLYSEKGLFSETSPEESGEDVSEQPRSMRGERQPTRNTLQPNQAQELGQNDKPPKTYEGQSEKEIAEDIERTLMRINGLIAGKEVGGNDMPKKVKQIPVELPPQRLIIEQDEPKVHLDISMDGVANQLGALLITAVSQIGDKMTDAVKTTLDGKKEVRPPDIIINVPEQAAPVIQLPEQPAPVINVSPRVEATLQMPETEETTEVSHDSQGRVVGMKKRVKPVK